MNIQHGVNDNNCAQEVTVAHVPVGLAMCITALFSNVLTCNGWSAAQAQVTPLVEINAFCIGGESLSANTSGGAGREQFPATLLEWRGFRFVTIHASDRRTDAENCNSNIVHCITRSHAVKTNLTNT